MILPKIGVSSTNRYVPTFYIGRREMFPYESLKVAWQMRDWFVKKQNGFFTVTHGRTNLLLTWDQLGNICEWKSFWEKYYLPEFSLDGKTVLDVGAGCGETACFYFQHGVKRVIAIEMDPVQVKLLKRNSELNSWNNETNELKIISRAFELEDLRKENFDFVKMDIEGGEASLLSLDRVNFPIVLEVHGKKLRDQFVQKFGMFLVTKFLLEDSWFRRRLPYGDSWLLRNY